MRYLPLTDADRSAMLDKIGVGATRDLYCDVPAGALLTDPVDLPLHKGEQDVERTIAALGAKNISPSDAPCFLGAGAYRHHIPATVDYMIQRGEFLTAYTPYQPEVSQGTLQALFEFQTQVALLTGMDVANASMYDGASACAEAVMMAARITRRGRAVLSGGLHPHYRAVADTHARFLGHEMTGPAPRLEGDEDIAGLIDDNTACVVVQTPDVFGRLHDLTALAEACHEKGALLIAVFTEAVSLGLIAPPGEMGADIVVGEGQSIGNALSFGGPYVGLFATRDKYVRQMPGRVCGQTRDSEGKRGWVLTLSTREQHIRREKATSNICTNAGLCALAFTVHMSLLGEDGLRRLAEINHAKAVMLADKVAAINGVRVVNDTFFNEFTVELTRPAALVVEDLAARGILGGVPLSRLMPGRAQFANHLLLAASETVGDDDIARLCAALKEVL
ncbi:aminomethyl-transferring glycine dehydrogenase subunit GcvPA [Varunaivibrio sulfuroxidans]|uniref:Probable glycine dehydrogenase (decarboxylating) subunit 1 n=1 Tax=Varunaivibrio sulfuroxidans TaxID=1773489 RepID=A0A4R3JC18_9PROT|nr:aminomethyl-transferring glycine dehydrogenase subunit GcvPA [Varunaivibrio sulfuroxidans]TCS62666.1 glycine dehydrogenase (decarboxylating) alpha subunit [Varunaivibrio sulfuroxidans]WES30669.1 aminomethyl-transferring glycine dehydrogenase subunit GcvPA [Varunaivibrio sulfuroxidans]